MSTQNFGFVRSTQIFFTTMGMFIANQGKLLKWVCYGVLTISAFVLYLVYSNNVQGWTVFGQYYWVEFILSLSIKTGTDPIIIDWGQARFGTTYARFVSDAWTQDIVGAV